MQSLCPWKSKKGWGKQVCYSAFKKSKVNTCFFIAVSIYLQHWLLVMCDSTNYIWSYYLKEKSYLKTEMIEPLKDLQTTHSISIMQKCRGKRAFESICKQERVRVNLEYTATSMAQQNGCIEWKFTMLFNHI